MADEIEIAARRAPPEPPPYSRRHLDPAEAAAYGRKFARSPARRLGALAERRLVRRFLVEAWFELTGTEIGDPPPAPAPLLLDLPCGNGRFAPLLASAPVRYLAADFSPEMLRRCRERLGREGLATRLYGTLRCDARSIPLPEASVDLAFCLRLVHHFPESADRRALLASFRRCLRGPLVLSFLDAGAPKQWMHRRRRALAGGRVRRVLLAREELAAEAAAAGFVLRRAAGLSGWFSGQTLALLTPAD